MSRTKAQLIEVGVSRYGIKNAAEMTYGQLEQTIKQRRIKPVPKPRLPRRQTVEVRKGRVRYYYVIKGANGEIMSTSQKYFSKNNARRAATRVARAAGALYKSPL